MIYFYFRALSVARLNWSANRANNNKIDLDEDEAKERKTGDTFNPNKEPFSITITTPEGNRRSTKDVEKRMNAVMPTMQAASLQTDRRGSPVTPNRANTPTNLAESSAYGASPVETPICSPDLSSSHLPSTDNSKTLTPGGTSAVSPATIRPKLGQLKGQTSTSLDSSRTLDGNDTFDYSTDNYLSDISCDIPE